MSADVGAGLDLTQRAAVVTGVANPRGIGFALCRAYAEAGARLVLADVDHDGAEARAEELRTAGHDAVAVRTDMGDHDSIKQLADTSYEQLGRVHILHLNHVARGGGPGHGLLAPDTDAWEFANQVNFLGVLRAIKAFVPRMVADDDWGYVLATASGAGVTGLMYGNGPYAVSKAAITALMECLYGQLRDAGSKIRAGVVVPGLVATMQTDEIAQGVVANLRANGFPATLTRPEEVANFTVDAMSRDRFWVHPGLDEDARLAGGKHRETIEWANAMYHTKAGVMERRDNPDPYLWGPPSDAMG